MASTPNLPIADPVVRARRASVLPALVCVLFFVSGLAQTAIVPLLPRISSSLHAGGSFSATLLAMPGLAMLVVALPAGLLADRFGARRVTLAAVGLLVAGAASGAVASTTVLIAGRLVYGISFGVLWTAGAAWLAELGGRRGGGAAVGRAVVCSSVGTMVGPALGGALGTSAGVGAEPGGLAFLIIALAGAVIGLTVAAVSPGAADAPMLPVMIVPGRRRKVVTPQACAQALRISWRSTRSMLGDRLVVAGAGSLAVSGALAGVTQLLVPEGLHADGLPAGAIGLVFSAAAIGYIATSALLVRLGTRSESPAINAIVTALGALALVPAVASGSSLVIIAALLFTAAPRGAISVVAYGVASRARHRSGSVYGVLGMAWAAATVVMPLLAAALQGAAGDRAAYLAAIVPGAAIAAVLLALALPRGARAGADVWSDEGAEDLQPVA